MSRRVAWLLLLLFFAFSCPGQIQSGSFLKLKAGKKVKVLAAVPAYDTSGKPLGFMLQYETELNVTDKTALRKEADEVFAAIQPFKYAIGKRVIVSAVEKASKSQGYNFVYETWPNGSWHCLDDQK